MSLETLAQFFLDKEASNNNFLTETKVKEVYDLWNSLKKETVETGDTIICLELGKFGNIEIRQVSEIETPKTLKYDEGSYDYISIASQDDRTILFTDYSITEPYNRQPPFYVGYSFSNLNLIKDNGDYREFQSSAGKCRITFAVWGFSFNHYWNLIKFGMCIKTDNVPEFISKIRKIFGK